MDNKVVERIKKLLSLATSPNEHEARMAAEKANELLLRFNLTASEVESRTDDAYENREVYKSKKLAFEVRWVLMVVEAHFFVRTLFKSSYWGHSDFGSPAKAWFIGEKTNVEVASYVFSFLTHQYKQLWKQYQKENNLPNELKGAYYKGLTYGLIDQLDKKRKNIEKEMSLVVVVDPNLDKQVEKYHPKVKETRLNIMKEDDAVVADGFAKGKTLKISKGLTHSGGPADVALEDRRAK